MGSVLPFMTGAIWLYVLLRFVRPLSVARSTRIVVGLVLFAVAQVHQVTGRYFGTLASPELPRWVLIGLSWAFGCFLLLALLVLARDVIGCLVFPVARRAGRWLLAGTRQSFALAALAVALSAFGVWQAVRVPSVKTVQVSLSGLPQAFDGYRIVQLTDLHASRLLPRDWQSAVVARTDALHPDLIVITGDLTDGLPRQRAADVAPFRDFHARDGVIAVPGNHEYYSDYHGWMAAYRALGLDVLENQHVFLHRDGATLAVAGLTDRQANAFGMPGPNLEAALTGIPAGMPVILLEHRPGDAARHAAAGVMLQLSGHTHGGQILGPSLITKWENHGFLSGLYRVGAMVMYVSSGTGLWNGLALRLGVPSEITQLVLHRR